MVALSLDEVLDIFVTSIPIVTFISKVTKNSLNGYT